MPFTYGETTYKGRYTFIRSFYFKERSPERIKELENLLNDVEYLISELSRIEKRSCCPSMVSIQIRNLAMQLIYLLRKKDFGSDAKVIRYLVERFNVTVYTVRTVLFDKFLVDAWFLSETEAGKELDIYIPPDEVYQPSKHFRFKGKKFEFLLRKDLILCIEELSKRLEDKRRKNK